MGSIDRRLSVVRACGVSLALVLLAGTPAGASQPGKTIDGIQVAPAPIEVSLTPRWTVGDEVGYVFTIEHEQTSGPKPPAAGESATIVTRQEVNVRRRVLDVTDQSIRLALIYDRVQVRISAGGQTAEVDTAKPADTDGDATLGEIARSVAGRTINITLAPDGRVIGVEGNGITRGNEPSARALVGREVFDQQLKPLWSLPEVPAKPRTGSSWAHNERLPMGHMGTLLTEARYQISGVTGEANKIADVTASGPSRIVPAVGPAARPVEHREGEFTATIGWDATGGRLERYDGTRTLGFDLPQGESATRVSTRTRVTITRSDAAPASAGDSPSAPQGAPAKDGAASR